jgi:hypothetical protein
MRQITPAQIKPGMRIEWGAGNYYTVLTCKPSPAGMRATVEWAAGRTRQVHILDGDPIFVVKEA